MKVASVALALIAAYPIAAVAQGSLRLLVGNYEQVLEFSIDPASAQPQLLSTTELHDKQPWPAQFELVLQRREKRIASWQQGATTADLPSAAKWNEFSPDCRWSLVGFEHPRFDVMRTFSYGQSTPWLSQVTIKLTGFNFVLDVAWAPDSRQLLVVETEERYSKSPTALLSGFLGHPVPLETLYLLVIDMKTKKQSRTKFLTDFPYATVALSSEHTECPSH